MPHSSDDNRLKLKLIKGKKMIEKRREARKQLNFPVNITLYEIVGDEVESIRIEAHTKDISMNGLGIDMKIKSYGIWERLNDFSSCKNFYIDLEFATPKEKVLVSGTIVRCKIINEEKKELQLGIFLKRMNEKIREEWNSFFKDTLLTIKE